jgi:two-component system, NarL family, invasion response regulator UvrY
MLKVLIADDHTIFREGLKRVLEEHQELSVSGEAEDGWKALREIRKQCYDIILLDISMPGKDGLEVLKEIRAENIHVPVLILSMYPEEQYALRALKAGASGYLTKESAPEELLEAIRRITEGGKYISSSIAERLADALLTKGSKTDNPHELLSDREYQVLCMIGAGKTVTEIGEELSLSVKTIATYRSRIIEKTGLKNNSEIIRYVVRKNLIP